MSWWNLQTNLLSSQYLKRQSSQLTYYEIACAPLFKLKKTFIVKLLKLLVKIHITGLSNNRDPTC